MKTTIVRGYTVAVISVLAVLLTCSKSNNNPTGPSGSKVNDYTIAYTSSGDTLFITTAQSILSTKECFGDSMTFYSDTSPASSGITVYGFDGNTLRLVSSITDTMSTSGAVVEYSSELSRIGTGTGIIGLWKYTGESYRVISGTLQPTEVQSLDAEMAVEDTMLLSMVAEYQITSSQINLYISGTLDYATEFINYQWDYSMLGDPASADSAIYNVTVNKVGENKLTLTGNVSHEVVTIKWVVSGVSNYPEIPYTMVYTSSNSAHAAYSYYSNPQTCPDDYYPAWWDDFMTANEKTGLLKSLSKQRAHHPKQIRNPLFPRSLLFVK
ncbi:MAG TPA: hypothetical protein VKF42_05980 [Chitinivibrionales bacterium]|nr:hypothetical protein [Chitinivibrionales bacterium]